MITEMKATGKKPYGNSPCIGETAIMDVEMIIRTLAERRSEIAMRFGITPIGVFGSVVRGEYKHGSDIDVLVSMDESVSLLEWAGAANYLTDLFGVKVDVVPVEDIRQELMQTIMEEVVRL